MKTKKTVSVEGLGTLTFDGGDVWVYDRLLSLPEKLTALGQTPTHMQMLEVLEETFGPGALVVDSGTALTDSDERGIWGITRLLQQAEPVLVRAAGDCMNRLRLQALHKAGFRREVLQ